MKQINNNSKYHVSKILIIIAAALLLQILIIAIPSIIFINNHMKSRENRQLLINNDEYISGDFSKRPSGDIAKNFFPKHETISDKAEFEYRYFTLGDNVKLSHNIDNSRRFRSLFMLELLFSSSEHYLETIAKAIEGEDVFRSAAYEDYYGYVFNSRYSSFPETVAYILCNDELKTISFMLFVGTTYKDSLVITSRIDRDIPPEYWFYEGSTDKCCLYTLIMHKIPTGSRALGAINVIEKDQYGRILYSVAVSGEMLVDASNGSAYAYLICQGYDEENIRFYDNKCLIFVDDIMPATEDQLSIFKENNDWNKPIDTSKFSTRKIVKSVLSDVANFRKEKLESFISSLINDEKFVYDVCDNDSNGNLLVFVRSKKYSNNGELQLGNPLVMIINEDQNGEYSIANDGLLQMDSMFDLEIVATIKSESNWGS